MFAHPQDWTSAAVAALTALLALSPAQAQSDEKAPAPVTKETAATPAPKQRASLLVWRRTRQFQRLEREILTKLKLSDDQRHEIRKKFEDLYRGFRDDPPKARYAPRVYRAFTPEEKKAHEDKLAAAKAAGKTKQVEAIQKLILQHTPGTDANLKPVAEDITTEVAEFLRPKQLARYQSVVDRWKALEPRTGFDGPIRMLARAVSDPELDLTPKQNEMIGETLKKAMSMAPKERPFDTMEKLGQEARAEIFQVLTPNQRKIMQKTIAVFAKWMKEEQDYAIEWYKSIGKRLPHYLERPIPFQEDRN